MLCEEIGEEEVCPSAAILPIPTELDNSLKAEAVATLKGGFEVKCKKATMEGETTKEEDGAAAPLIGTITSMTYTECSTCSTVELLNLPYKTSIVPTEKSVGNGTLTLESSGKGNPTFKESGCPLGASCSFAAEKPKFKFEGGESPGIEAEAISMSYAGGSGEFVCGKTSQISQDNRMPVGPVAPGLSSVLCEQATRRCPGTKTYGPNAELEAKLSTGTARWTPNGGPVIDCTSSTLIGQSAGIAGVRGTLSPTFGTCTTSGTDPCEVELRNLGGGYSVLITAIDGAANLGNGELKIPDMSVKLRCKNQNNEVTFECQYGWATGNFLAITGGNPKATMAANTNFNRESGTCTGGATWTGSYVFEKQKPMFVI